MPAPLVAGRTGVPVACIDEVGHILHLAKSSEAPNPGPRRTMRVNGRFGEDDAAATRADLVLNHAENGSTMTCRA
ncbi:MAG: hypothetical protein R6V44_09250 [Paracoccaceae bacterium]